MTISQQTIALHSTVQYVLFSESPHKVEDDHTELTWEERDAIKEAVLLLMTKQHKDFY